MIERWPKWSEHFSRVAADPASGLRPDHLATAESAICALESMCGLTRLPAPAATETTDSDVALVICWDAPQAVVLLDVYRDAINVEWFWRIKHTSQWGGSECLPGDAPPRGAAEAMSLIRAGLARGADEKTAE